MGFDEGFPKAKLNILTNKMELTNVSIVTDIQLLAVD